MNSITDKPKVFVSCGGTKIPKCGVDLLTKQYEVSQYTGDSCPREILLQEVVGKDAIVISVSEMIDAELLDIAGPQLKFVTTASVGFEHIDVQECKKRGILVTNTSGPSTNTVAELGIGLLLSVARRIVECTTDVRKGEWQPDNMMGWKFGLDIAGSTIGIFGLGKIGRAVAKRLQCFEPKQIFYTDILEIPEAQSLGAKRVTFDVLLSESDFIIACSTLTPFTQHIFNERAFSKMKPDAIFVNISRGGVVDQNALQHALIHKTIRGAGLDVFEVEPIPENDPLLKFDNCVLTPHVGGATNACRCKMSARAAENIMAALRGERDLKDAL